jgi:hypothetical protein
MTDVLTPVPQPVKSTPVAPITATDELRTLVTLSRQEEDDCGQRQIVVRLDGTPKVDLLFGESVTADVEPGIHRMWVHNTLFWKTIRFTVEPGEHLEFAVVNRAGPMTLGFLAVLGVGPLFLSVRRRSLQ